jgi:hypothetical protein
MTNTGTQKVMTNASRFRVMNSPQTIPKTVDKADACANTNIHCSVNYERLSLAFLSAGGASDLGKLLAELGRWASIACAKAEIAQRPATEASEIERHVRAKF